MKRALLSFALACAIARASLAAPINVPVYIEDSHAGSFYWLAQHLALDEPVTLLHFDAHSDASAVFDSDKLRERLRRVHSLGERSDLLRNWRAKGVVQCFDWIEPLMPAPVAQVIWIGPGADRDLAQRQLDGELEAAPRQSGRLAPRYGVAQLHELQADFAPDTPLVASIDLDSFSGMEPRARAEAFERAWRIITERPNLRAVTIAISRSYLVDDEEADALVRLALAGALSWPTAAIHFEPFAAVGNDRSLRAREYRQQGREVPAFDLAKSSAELRALLMANSARISVQEDAARFSAMLAEWRNDAPAVRLKVADREPSTDAIWRIDARERAEVKVVAEPWYAEVASVRWFVEKPEYLRCNLVSAGEKDVSFARGAPPRPRWRDVELPQSGNALPIEALREFLDERTGCGAVRLKARVEGAGWVRYTPAIELRRFVGSGFRAALTEQFGLPYLFGSGALRDGHNTGPETGWGADCANFLIYALRRQGLRVPWSNPKQFRSALETVGERLELNQAPVIADDDLEAGLIVHLGAHVAAVFEDRAPFGVLDGGDIVAHQLEGAPELLPLSELLRARGRERFDLLRVPAAAARPDLLIGGDIMLGRSVSDAVVAGADPFAGISHLLADAPVRLANLECVISERGTPVEGKKFTFRAPPSAAASLGGAGWNVLGLANNHASDFGPIGLRDSIDHLRANGLAVVGTAETIDQRYAPHVVTTDAGKRIALLAVADVALGETEMIATASDRARLSEALSTAEADADVTVVLVHWGEENTARVNEAQRELARWLIDHGADLVAGSHPHCIQPLDYYH
ncbi:MAG TPA: CapA family protein, partial [Chthoniobacterales bacterium]